MHPNVSAEDYPLRLEHFSGCTSLVQSDVWTAMTGVLLGCGGVFAKSVMSMLS